MQHNQWSKGKRVHQHDTLGNEIRQYIPGHMTGAVGVHCHTWQEQRSHVATMHCQVLRQDGLAMVMVVGVVVVGARVAKTEMC
jgi:hypothetical protein